jgi:hypothetical protein
MSQYSNEFGSIIKQLRKISVNTCIEGEQLAYYEKEVCGTLPDVEGQADQFILIRVYTRDIDTGQIVLSHYEDMLGNVVSGTVVEACCDSAVCRPPFSCNAVINSITPHEDALQAIAMDITGSSTTGFMQIDVAGTILGPIASPWPTIFPAEITYAFQTGETTITLMIGNNEEMDHYCSFSFVTLTAVNSGIKETAEDPDVIWNPFPALVGDLMCAGTLTYSMILDTTGNGVTINSTTGDLTIPAGIYLEENSWVYVEVKCDGVLVAVTGLQLLNAEPEEPMGFILVWNDIANTPFVTHTDLNTFINSNGGAANYTSVVTVGNVQTFYGGTAVDLGDKFMAGDANIVSIRDEAFQVVAQGTACEKACDLLETIALPALIIQAKGCQNGNPALTSLNLQALTTQGTNNQSSNASLVSISLPSLTTQTSDNQSDNAALTTFTANLLTSQTDGNQRDNTVLASITTPLLTGIGKGNYVGCTCNILTINVDASLFGAADILLAQAGGATII